MHNCGLKVAKPRQRPAHSHFSRRLKNHAPYVAATATRERLSHPNDMGREWVADRKRSDHPATQFFLVVGRQLPVGLNDHRRNRGDRDQVDKYPKKFCSVIIKNSQWHAQAGRLRRVKEKDALQIDTSSVDAAYQVVVIVGVGPDQPRPSSSVKNGAVEIIVANSTNPIIPNAMRDTRPAISKAGSKRPFSCAVVNAQLDPIFRENGICFTIVKAF